MNKKYDEEFKREALRLVEEEGLAPSRVEKDLGISHGLIKRWKQALLEHEECPFPGHGQKRIKETEMAQLQKEISELRMERDILKKAMGILSVAK